MPSKYLKEKGASSSFASKFAAKRAAAMGTNPPFNKVGDLDYSKGQQGPKTKDQMDREDDPIEFGGSLETHSEVLDREAREAAEAKSKSTTSGKTKSWEKGYEDWGGEERGTMTEFRGEAEKWWSSPAGQKYAKEKGIKHRILTEDPTTTKERPGGTKIIKTETPEMKMKQKEKEGKIVKEVIKTPEGPGAGKTKKKGPDVEGGDIEKYVENPKGIKKGQRRRVYKKDAKREKRKLENKGKKTENGEE